MLSRAFRHQRQGERARLCLKSQPELRTKREYRKSLTQKLPLLKRVFKRILGR